MNQDRYQAYVETSTIAAEPLRLVTAMYERAIECTQQAQSCLQHGDIWGRSKAVSNAMGILSELIASLNPEAGPEIGRNLDRLYHYMQNRLLEAHAKQIAEPLQEVERLLANLLQAWHVVARNVREATNSETVPQRTSEIEEMQSPYQAYLGCVADSCGLSVLTA